MRCSKRAFSVAGSAAATGLTLTLIVYLATRTPEYYARLDTLPDEERVANARQFVRQSTSIWNQIENESRWSGTFRDAQVNSWFADDFTRKHASLLPAGVSDPRVCFEADRIALAFRLQRGPLQIVVSATGRMWLAEPNLIAIEIEAAHAGQIPIPTGFVIRTASSAARSAGIAIDWKQHRGHAVALVRVGKLESSPISLDRLMLGDGRIHVAGRSRSNSRGLTHSAANADTATLRE